MRVRSIGSKLTIWYATLFSLTFLILGFLTYALLSYSLFRDMDYALNGVAKVMVGHALERDSSFFPAEIDELFQRFLGFSPLERQIDIFNPRGQLERRQRMNDNSHDFPLSEQALRAAAEGQSTFETIQFSSDYPVRMLTAPVIADGRVINLVRVGMSLENMHKTKQRFLLIMAGVFPFGLLLSGGGGWLLARRALRPVDKMTQTAHKISGEHLNERLSVSGSGDELDRLAVTLNDMLDRLDDSINQMRRFSADASHELQTPLTILKGEMEVALRQPRSTEEYQQVLLSGLEEIARINHLVEGLLLLARADAGVLQLDVQKIELKELVEEICEQMQLIADSHSVEIQNDLPRPVVVEGDREHLRRLVLNLIDNGIKYTLPGGSVRVSLRSDGHTANVSVADTGIGLTNDQLEKIFSRFHRAPEARVHDGKGVGLGLNIALSIAKAHGGTIGVESKLDQGSIFSLSLPVASQ